MGAYIRNISLFLVKMYLALFISAILLSPAHLFPANDESRIYRGREANDGEFPWMVFIRLTDELNCSGFLISASYVLTAAHCMIDRSVNDMAGVVGSVDREAEMLEFQRYIIHPDYNATTFDSDIALLQFKMPLQLSNIISSICIGKKTSFFTAGNAVLQMGWGRDRIDSKIVSKKLKVTDVGKIITKNRCETFFEYIKLSSVGKLCVMNSEVEGVCEGDSGGPLVYSDGNRQMAIGLDSVGMYSECNVTNLYPEIYTNVSYFSEWIVDNVDESVCLI